MKVDKEEFKVVSEFHKQKYRKKLKMTEEQFEQFDYENAFVMTKDKQLNLNGDPRTPSERS